MSERPRVRPRNLERSLAIRLSTDGMAEDSAVNDRCAANGRLFLDAISRMLFSVVLRVSVVFPANLRVWSGTDCGCREHHGDMENQVEGRAGFEPATRATMSSLPRENHPKPIDVQAITYLLKPKPPNWLQGTVTSPSEVFPVGHTKSSPCGSRRSTTHWLPGWS